MGRRAQLQRCGQETDMGKQHRLLVMGYDRAAKDGGPAITHNKRAFQIQEEFI
jgi:hypothetical protein